MKKQARIGSAQGLRKVGFKAKTEELAPKTESLGSLGQMRFLGHKQLEGEWCWETYHYPVYHLEKLITLESVVDHWDGGAPHE